MKKQSQKGFGIPDFPYRVDFETDEKLAVIINEFGMKGEMIVTKLFAWTYMVNGYYTEWSADGQEQFLSRYAYLQFTPNLVSEVVNRMLKWGIFHQGMHDQFLILTSEKIQNTWHSRVKNRKGYFIDSRFSLLRQKPAVLVKTGSLKGIWDAGELEPLNATDQQTVLGFIEWLKRSAPRVLEMRETFTVEEALRICKEANNNRAKEVFLNMHNWQNLNVNINANLTFWNWYRRHEAKFPSFGQTNQQSPQQQKTRKEL